ncbi:hypothetical protein AAY86_00675 [Pseudomonas amygdali pv. tabaci str. ATCC 11528]|nr:hypothetical protein C1E_0211760 [Pseudomonas amygdali pv. tabaci str. ATCC 11528]KKY54668.1 hypothetical protein AAY86_00675 [Pseudomonas amygdali pv. tabaci str. ATCC 11528]QED83715.1 hypothetical protein PSYTB_08515 [Pseudomonas amygdali pv. tabaci str. ATCC 11528]
MNYILNAGTLLIVALTLASILRTPSQAQDAVGELGKLSHDLAQQRIIQLSQAAYAEQRLNTLSERLDNTTNRLESRVQMLETRRQSTIQ